MNSYKMFFVQTSTPIPNMHWKLNTDREIFLMQNNELLTKTPVGIKDNSVA